jgi:hypothetical protein
MLYLGILILVSLACDAYAQVGERISACDRKFGGHTGDLFNSKDADTTARVWCRYQWQGYSVQASFGGRRITDMHCVCLDFWKPGRPLTDTEIDSLLANNTGGSSWLIVHKEDVNALRGWKREDNRALAVTRNGKNGMLQIFTPDYYKHNIPDGLPTFLRSLPPELRP